MSYPFRRAATTLAAIIILLCQFSVPTRTTAAHSFDNPSPLRKADPATTNRVQESYGKLPLSFEANQGQFDPQVKFASRGGGYSLSFTQTEMAMTLHNDKPGGRFDLRMQFRNANQQARIEGVDPLPGRSNYLIGSDRSKWRTDVANYARVRYREIYPGIDLVFYGNPQLLEYDFVLKPGADPNMIRLSFDGVKRMNIDRNGDLVLQTPGGEVVQRKPFVYQEVNGEKKAVAGRYAIKGTRKVGFRIGQYDRSRPLVIDPVLVFSTLLGGRFGDAATAIAVDGEGNAYVTGRTPSPDFPAQGPAQPAVPRDTIFKSAAAGASWSGTGRELAGLNINQLVIDPKTPATLYAVTERGLYKSADGGGVWRSLRSDFLGALAIDPVNPNTLYAAEKAPFEMGKVFKSANGGGSWTELAGIETDVVYAIAVDPANPATVYVGTGKGLYKSTDGGATWNLRPFCVPGETPCRPYRVNAVAIDPRNPARVYAAVDERMFITDNGGGEWIQIFNQVETFDIRAIVVDPSSTVYVVNGNFRPGTLLKSADAGRNWTGLGIFARTLAIDPQNPSNLYAGLNKGLVKSVNGGADWANISAGTSRRPVNSIVVDPANPAQVYIGAAGLATDAFVAKLNASGTALAYVAYLGGSEDDSGYGIAVDSQGSAYVTVAGNSFDYPMVNAVRNVSVNSYFRSVRGFWGASKSLGGVRLIAPAAKNDETVYAANDDGVFVVNDFSNWKSAAAGLPKEPVTALAVDPRNSVTLYAATFSPEMSGAIYKREKAGDSWMKLNTGAIGKVNAFTIDPNNSAVVYAALNTNADPNSGGVLKTTDGGASWRRLTNGLTSGAHGQTAVLGIRQMAVDPMNSDTLYAVALPGLGLTPPSVRKSSDGGNTWTASGLIGPVNSIVIDPKNPSTIYAAVSSFSPQPGVMKTTDSGATWQRVWPALPGNVDPGVVALAIDPETPATVYAGVNNTLPSGTLKNGVYKSEDGGTTWKLASTGLPEAGVVALAVNPLFPQIVYAGLNRPADVAELENYTTNLFATKLNPAGSQIVYSTYVTRTGGGGGVVIETSSIAVDASGSAYVAGASIAGFLQTTPNAIQPNPRDDTDAFIVKLNPAGSQFVYATYLGGSGYDAATAIAVDGAGNAYVTGKASGQDFPTTPGSYRPMGGGSWIAKLNPGGASLIYSTYFAGDPTGIAIDAASNAYITGAAYSGFPVTPGAFQQTYLGDGILGGGDAFVAKLSADGSTLVYSTLLGGAGNDSGSAIAVDSAGNAVVTGATRSSLFPVTSDAVQAVADGGVCGSFRFDPRSQPVPVACYDAFLTKLNADGSALIYSTYLGGKPADDVAAGLALDSNGAAYIAGYTNAMNFPTSQGAVQIAARGSREAFITKIETRAGGTDTLASVSAATYRGAELAPESIAAAFGSRLATKTEAATADPLPTTLAGTSVKVRDRTGTERLASLFFVSEKQINYQMPTGTAPGDATITITSGANVISTGSVRIVDVAPGLFTANASGQGLPAAFAQRLRNNTTIAYEPVARFDAAQNRFEPVPIDLGPEGDVVYLVLYGTGFRRRSALSAVSVKIGGADMTINYAGPQLQLVGLDQINVLLSRNLAGRGEVDVVVTVDGKPSNTVKVSIQ